MVEVEQLLRSAYAPAVCMLSEAAVRAHARIMCAPMPQPYRLMHTEPLCACASTDGGCVRARLYACIGPICPNGLCAHA